MGFYSVNKKYVVIYQKAWEISVFYNLFNILLALEFFFPGSGSVTNFLKILDPQHWESRFVKEHFAISDESPF